jgi:hypothetical protein
MGLAPGVLRTMIAMHGERPWSGPALMLGMQDVLASYPDMERMFAQAKVSFSAVPSHERSFADGEYIRQVGWENRRYIHAQTLFRMLGIPQAEALDFSDYERASLIHDLNEPIPESWHGRYGLIVDGGTIEHVFDMRSSLTNIVRLLRMGGDVLHVSPMSGWANHGFYQLSPCLFYDFYAANGFEISSAATVDIVGGDPGKDTIKVYQHTAAIVPHENPNVHRLFVFRARKTVEAEIVIPTQGIYQKYRQRTVA